MPKPKLSDSQKAALREQLKNRLPCQRSLQNQPPAVT